MTPYREVLRESRDVILQKSMESNSATLSVTFLNPSISVKDPHGSRSWDRVPVADPGFQPNQSIHVRELSVSGLSRSIYGIAQNSRGRRTPPMTSFARQKCEVPMRLRSLPTLHESLKNLPDCVRSKTRKGVFP